MFLALDEIATASREAGIESSLEAAVICTQNHSAADGNLGDAVLIGVSRIEQLKPIMDAADNGPLPDTVVASFERAAEFVKMKSEYYLQYPYPKEGSPWQNRLN